MRLLLLHSDFIEYDAVLEVKISVRDPPEKKRLEEVLVVFTAAESGDSPQKIQMAASEIMEVVDQVKAPRVLIYPFVHLTDTPSQPPVARNIIQKLAALLSEKIETHTAPFGWYKKFTIQVKGHPLAELSKRF